MPLASAAGQARRSHSRSARWSGVSPLRRSARVPSRSMDTDTISTPPRMAYGIAEETVERCERRAFAALSFEREQIRRGGHPRGQSPEGEILVGHVASSLMILANSSKGQDLPWSGRRRRTVVRAPLVHAPHEPAQRVRHHAPPAGGYVPAPRAPRQRAGPDYPARYCPALSPGPSRRQTSPDPPGAHQACAADPCHSRGRLFDDVRPGQVRRDR